MSASLRGDCFVAPLHAMTPHTTEVVVLTTRWHRPSAWAALDESAHILEMGHAGSDVGDRAEGLLWLPAVDMASTGLL